MYYTSMGNTGVIPSTYVMLCIAISFKHKNFKNVLHIYNSNNSNNNYMQLLKY